MNLPAKGTPPERGGRQRLRAARLAGLCLGAWALTGCSSAGYYWQSVSGHLELMRAARPVAEWVQEPATPDLLRSRLQLAERIRTFAVTDLHLPDNASYHRYADLGRPAAVWNVVAAPEYSLTLKTWCFPVVGCVGYRGYFSEAAAQAEAAGLRAEGLEVSVYGVPAYSTLGWMNWAGGDPLLNTFIHYPEGELARMLFHELAHQVVFARDDILFNESFATAVERLGGERWLATRANDAARAEYRKFDERRREFRALARETRAELAGIYGSSQANVGDNRSKFAMKSEALNRFRQRYSALRERWEGDPAQFRGFDAWVARANNAAFAVQAAYDEFVPAFEALHAREGGDWKRFYDAVRRLANMPQAERHRALKELTRA